MNKEGSPFQMSVGCLSTALLLRNHGVDGVVDDDGVDDDEGWAVAAALCSVLMLWLCL